MLLPLILAGVVGATGQPGGEHAALLYLRGEIAAARVEMSSVLARSPADAPTLFVRACLELETTGPDATAPFVVALERLRPPPPQARVLRQLLARRLTAPTEPLGEALVGAWKSAGRAYVAVSA